MKRHLKPGSAAWWNARTRFDPATGCVLWTGFVCPLGYARTYWKYKGGVLVHRIAYEQVHGPFDQSLKVCHRCDTPHCVNPDHLFLGTQKDNLRDMFAKGRARPQGKTTAPLTVFPSVSRRRAPSLARSVASEKSNAYVRMIDPIHLIGTSSVGTEGAPSVSDWRHVSGLPVSRPTQAIVVYTAPRKWTPEPASSRDAAIDCRDSGGILAGVAGPQSDRCARRVSR